MSTTPAAAAVTARPVFGETKTEPSGLPGDGAARQIEPVTQLGQQHQPPSGPGRRASRRPAATARSAEAGPRTRADAARVPAARLPPPRTSKTASPSASGSSIASAAPGCTSSAEKLPSCSASRATQRTCTILPACHTAVRPRAPPPRARPRCTPYSSVITVATASPSPYGREPSTIAGASHSITVVSCQLSVVRMGRAQVLAKPRAAIDDGRLVQNQ